MATTLAIMNQKGGVGKTTLTVHLGVGLAALGYQVCLIDMDPQGHLSVSFDIGDEPEDGIFELLVNRRPLDILLRPIDPVQYTGLVDAPLGFLNLLPGGQRTQLAAVDIQLRGADFGAFGDAIEPLKEQYDFVLIDTSPTVALFTAAIIQATDYVLVPTEMSRLSFDGIRKIIRNMVNLEGLHNATVMGIVPMMTRPNTREYFERLQELQTTYPNLVWHEVGMTMSTVWKEAADAAMTIYKYVPGHKVVDQAWALCGRVLQAMEVS